MSVARVTGRVSGDSHEPRIDPSAEVFCLIGGRLMVCAAQAEEGSWVNVDPATRSITRAKLRFVCQDQILNGQPYPPGPPWYVQLWGSCSPQDCDWGEVGGDLVKLADRTVIRAIYGQGFATRHVYLDMSMHQEGRLWVHVWTNFTDPNRADYETHNWFVKQ